MTRSFGPQTICGTPPGPEIAGRKGVESAPSLASSIRSARAASRSLSPGETRSGTRS
jgi:hypothetical protein